MSHISDQNGSYASDTPDPIYISPHGQHVPILGMSDRGLGKAFHEILVRVGQKSEIVLREEEAIQTLLQVAHTISKEAEDRGLPNSGSVTVGHTNILIPTHG